MNSLVFPVDPSKLGQRFADPSPALDQTIGETEGLDELRELLRSQESDKVRPLLALLPSIEQDVIELRLQGIRESGIGELLGVTQEAVSYRWTRAIWRLKVLIEADYLSFTEGEIHAAVAKLGTRKDRQHWPAVAATYYRTTCQTEVAKELGIKLGSARYTVGAVTHLLLDAGPAYERFYRLFRVLTDNPNLLHEGNGHWAKKR